MVCELQLAEHVHQVLLADGVIVFILDFLECVLQFVGVLGGHFGDAHQSLLFLLLVGQLEVLDHFLNLLQEHLSSDALIRPNSLLLECILQEGRSVLIVKVEGLSLHHSL